MKQPIIWLWLCVQALVPVTVTGQSPARTTRLFATGYVAPAFRVGAAASFIKPGFQGNTGVEYRCTSALWVTAGLNVDIYGLKRSTANLTINSSLNLIMLSLSLTYCLRPRAVWQPYLTGGAGLNYLSGPTVQADYTRQQVEVSSAGSLCPAFQVGAGVQHPIGNNVTVYAEGASSVAMPVRYADIGLLPLVAIRFGIKSPLNVNLSHR